MIDADAYRHIVLGRNMVMCDKHCESSSSPSHRRHFEPATVVILIETLRVAFPARPPWALAFIPCLSNGTLHRSWHSANPAQFGDATSRRSYRHPSRRARRSRLTRPLTLSRRALDPRNCPSRLGDGAQRGSRVAFARSKLLRRLQSTRSFALAQSLLSQTQVSSTSLGHSVVQL